MKKYLDTDEEAERIKNSAENIFTDGGRFQPMLSVFQEGHYKGSILIREDLSAEVDEEDRKNASLRRAYSFLVLKAMRLC